MQRGKISFVLLVLLVASFLGVGEAKANVNDVNNWGCLQIDVRLEGKGLNGSAYILKHDLYYPGASDGIDDHDTEEVLFFPNMSGGYVLIEGKKLNQEVSANSSRTAKHVKGYFNGTIAPGSEPNIIVELSWLWAEPNVGRFGDMPLIATKEDSNGNNIENGGYRGDIRAEMDYSGPDFASIDFGKIPAGTYTPDTPLLHLKVDFDKLLGDLDNDNVVNLKDYAILAERWREEERSIADISGPNDVPDIKVDNYDLAIIARDWLEEMNDRCAWKKLANMPEGRTQHCFEELNGILYAMCGVYMPDYPNHHKNNLFAYNPATDSWVDKNPTGDIPAIRQSAIMRAVNGKLYLIGGLNSVLDGATYYKDVHEYDPIENTWTQKTDAPTAREDMASAVIDNKIYVFGGIDSVSGFVATKTVEVYTPATDSWAVLDDMPDARCLGDFGCAYNGKIYIISSTKDLSEYGDLNPTKRVDEFNPATGEWVQKADIPTARCYKEADVIGDRIFVVSGSGDSCNDWRDENEFLNVPDNTWHTHAPLPYAAQGVAQCVYDDKIYVCGGVGDGGMKDALYVFDPNIPATFEGAKNVIDAM